MYAYLLSFICFLLVSCQEVKKDFFYAKTNKRWFAAYKVEKINENYESLSDIQEPKGTIQPLLRIHYYQSDFKGISDCLFYRVSTLNDGAVSIVENPQNLDCNELFLKKPYAVKSSIHNFGIKLEGQSLMLRMDEENIQYDLLNIPKPTIRTVLKSSSDISIEFAAPILTKAKTVLLKEGDICKKVEDDCSVTFDRCSSCEGASYFLVNSKCSQGYSRICGIDRCGEKNEVACIRGVETSGMDMGFYCVNDSPVGFCQEGLRVICLNGTLYCE